MISEFIQNRIISFPFAQKELLPKSNGVYLISLKLNNEYLYIGSSKNIYNRVRNGYALKEIVKRYSQDNIVVSYICTNGYVNLEKKLIRRLNPKFNLQFSKIKKNIPSISTNPNDIRMVDVDIKLYERIKLLAQQNLRSISKQAEFIIAEYFKLVPEKR